MPSLTVFNLRFTPHWLMIVLASVFIALFIRLGFWQLQRSDEKKQMVAAEQALSKQEPLLWSAQAKLPLQYQRVQVTGTYLPDVFLLDNQHQQHQFGYDVLSPLRLANDEVVLVDRGWIRGADNRQTLPTVTVPDGTIELRGIAYFPSSKQWLLGPSYEKKTAEVTIIEVIDVKWLTQLLQKTVYPFIIRLDKHERHGFIRNWAIVSMPPERHVAYAVQWFAMAFVILIIFIALNLKKK
ncbi:MAG: SURF1 family protein [Legionella sp.]